MTDNGEQYNALDERLRKGDIEFEFRSNNAFAIYETLTICEHLAYLKWPNLVVDFTVDDGEYVICFKDKE